MKKVQIAYLGLNSLFGKVATNLLKQSPSIQRLTFYDDGEPIRSFDQPTSAYYGTNSLFEAIKEVDIVVIGEEECCARTVLEDHLEIIGPKILRYTKAIQEYSPNAIIVVATTPINVIFPLVGQLLGPDFKSRLLGTTSIDTIRASRIFSNLLSEVNTEVPRIVPVVGGSSPWTRVPLFSCHSQRKFEVNHDIREKIIETMKVFDKPVFKELDTIERAYSTVRFIHSIISGMTKGSQVIDMAMLRTNIIPEVDFFSLPVVLGAKGIETSIRVPNLDPSEKKMFDLATESLQTESQRAQYLIQKWENEARIEVSEELAVSGNSIQQAVLREMDGLGTIEKYNTASQRLDNVGAQNMKSVKSEPFKNEETTDNPPILKWQWNRIDVLEKKYYGQNLGQKNQSQERGKNKGQTTSRIVTKGGNKGKGKFRNKAPSVQHSPDVKIKGNPNMKTSKKESIDKSNYIMKGAGDNKMSCSNKNDKTGSKSHNIKKRGTIGQTNTANVTKTSTVDQCKQKQRQSDENAVKLKNVNETSYQAKGDVVSEDNRSISLTKKTIKKSRLRGLRKRKRKNKSVLIAKEAKNYKTKQSIAGDKSDHKMVEERSNEEKALQQNKMSQSNGREQSKSKIVVNNEIKENTLFDVGEITENRIENKKERGQILIQYNMQSVDKDQEMYISQNKRNVSDLNIEEDTNENNKKDFSHIQSAHELNQKSVKNTNRPSSPINDKRHLIENMNWKIKEDGDITEEPIQQINNEIRDRQNTIEGMSWRLNKEMSDIKSRKNIIQEAISQNFEKRSQQLAARLKENKNFENDVKPENSINQTVPQFIKIRRTDENIDTEVGFVESKIEGSGEKINRMGVTIKERLKWPARQEQMKQLDFQGINISTKKHNEYDTKLIGEKNQPSNSEIGRNINEDEKNMRLKNVEADDETCSVETGRLTKVSDTLKSTLTFMKELNKHESDVPNYSVSVVKNSDDKREETMMSQHEEGYKKKGVRKDHSNSKEEEEDKQWRLNPEQSSLTNTRDVIEGSQTNLGKEEQIKRRALFQAVDKKVHTQTANVLKISGNRHKGLVQDDTSWQPDKTPISVPKRIKSKKKICTKGSGPVKIRPPNNKMGRDKKVGWGQTNRETRRRVKSELNLRIADEGMKGESGWMEAIKENVKKIANDRIESDSKMKIARNRKMMSNALTYRKKIQNTSRDLTTDPEKQLIKKKKRDSKMKGILPANQEKSNKDLKREENNNSSFKKNKIESKIENNSRSDFRTEQELTKFKKRSKSEEKSTSPCHSKQLQTSNDQVCPRPKPLSTVESKEPISRKWETRSESKIDNDSSDYWDSKYFSKASEAFFKMFRDAVTTPNINTMSSDKYQPIPLVEKIKKPLTNQRQCENGSRSKNEKVKPVNELNSRIKHKGERSKTAKRKTPIEEITEEIQKGFAQMTSPKAQSVSGKIKNRTSSIDSSQNDIPTLTKLLRNYEEKEKPPNIDSLFRESSEIPITKPNKIESTIWANKPEDKFASWHNVVSGRSKGDVLNFTDFHVYSNKVGQTSVMNKPPKKNTASQKREGQLVLDKISTNKIKVPIVSKLIKQVTSPNRKDLLQKTTVVNDEFEIPKKSERICGIFKEIVVKEIEGSGVSANKPMSNFFNPTKPEKQGLEKLTRKIRGPKVKSRKLIVKKTEPYWTKDKSKGKTEPKLRTRLNKNENAQRKIEIAKPETSTDKAVNSHKSSKKNPKKIVNYFNQRGVASIFFENPYEPNYSVNAYKKND